MLRTLCPVVHARLGFVSFGATAWNGIGNLKVHASTSPNRSFRLWFSRKSARQAKPTLAPQSQSVSIPPRPAKLAASRTEADALARSDTAFLTQDSMDLEDWGEPTHLKVTDDFMGFASELRAHFDSRFADPRSFKGRFLWDYWHIPGQYTLIRTTAEAFFPPPLYRQLEAALLRYGETQLGCRALTPIWLSYYVEGCRQELHTDSPHGPFAFVLSLTNWSERKFSGGETQLLKPGVLDYWSSYDGYGMERTALVDLVEPLFNRLTVFDPRLPHGVTPVHGVHEPREARIVLHGWFADASPFFEGPLNADLLVESINSLMEATWKDLSVPPLDCALGLVTVRFSISAESGCVNQLSWLADTLVLPKVDDPGKARVQIFTTISDYILSTKFPVCPEGDTTVTLPFLWGPDFNEEEEGLELEDEEE